MDLVMNDAQVDEFLASPITAQLATNGPTIRPMWYQWERNAFWIISGPWAKLFGRVHKDPAIALCVDIGDFDGGHIKQVCAYGDVEITPYDVPLAQRMLERYLGTDQSTWSTAPDNYPAYLEGDGPEGAALLKLEPRKLIALDFSYARVRG